MTKNYVVEVVNGCCFEHDTEDIQILKRFNTKKAAIKYAKTVQRMTIRETAQFNLQHVYITSLRIIDTSLYPPHVLYEAEMNEIIPDLQKDDVPTWSLKSELSLLPKTKVEAL